MKKIFTLLSVVVFAAAVLAHAAEDGKPELRPAQKLMQARAAWLTAMSENLGAGKFEAVAAEADKLSAETGKSGEAHPNPLGKELTLVISSFAKEISAAAARKDGDAIRARMGDIKGKCGECHVKIRDKK